MYNYIHYDNIELLYYMNVTDIHGHCLTNTIYHKHCITVEQLRLVFDKLKHGKSDSIDGIIL